jgi:hypothetical protein
MNKLQLDVSQESAWRRVQQVISCGWHPIGGHLDDLATEALRGLWFFGDCAFGSRGELLQSDEFGIYWHEGVGYMLGDPRGCAREAKFFQGKPMLHPEDQIQQAPLELPEAFSYSKEEEWVRDFFQEISWRLDEALGGGEGRLMLGSFLSYAAGPEVYAQYDCFPGLWVHGDDSNASMNTRIAVDSRAKLPNIGT